MLAKHFSAVAVRTLIHISALWVIPLPQLDKNVSNLYWKWCVIWQLFEMRICMLAREMFCTLVATTALSVRLWFCLSPCLHSFGTFTWLLRLLFWLKVGLHGIFIRAHKPAGHADLEQQFHFHRTVKPGHRQLTSPIPVGKVKHMIIVLLYWSNQYSLNRAMNKSTH